MSLTISPRHEPRIALVAQAQHISTDEAIDRILDAGLDVLVPQTNQPRRSYESFFGVAKGRPGAHGSPEAADRYIEELRNAW